MPNRILKETICTSADIDKLTDKEEIFFYRLIVTVDDFGITDARESLLKARCFPLRGNKVREADIRKWLDKLSKLGMVMLYTVKGHPYLKMTSWENHQQVRAKRSKHPLPSEADPISNDIICNQVTSDDSICPRNPIQSESNPNPYPNPIQSNKKEKYGDFVTMSENEYNTLVEKLGEQGTLDCISILDNYKGASGKKYKSDYRAILSWVIGRYNTDKQRKGGITNVTATNKGLSSGFAMADGENPFK